MTYTLTLRSSIEELEDASIWIEKHLPSTVIAKTQNTILLVAQELITNAIVYGNENIQSKTIQITVQSDEKYIVLSIQDQGRGLPALPSKEEAQNMDYLEENGRGMKLAVLLSDEAIVERNKIIVKFNI